MNKVTGFLRHFENCNRYDGALFRPFYIDGAVFGAVHETLIESLPKNVEGLKSYRNGLSFADAANDFKSRSETLAKAAAWLSEKYDRPLRHEMYAVIREWGDVPVAQVDRMAGPWFGTRGFGVHVNGFVRKADGIYLWIGERAVSRSIDPGKLDNMIGGGQPIGLTLRENLRKEAAEEAGITDRHLIDSAQHVRTLRYKLERNKGLRNDTIFIFDLEVPETFTPINTDGEVHAFHLMPINQVAEIVHDTSRFKFNCNMVVIDFLVRHGFLDATDPEYQEIVRFLERDNEEHIAIKSAGE